MAVTLLVVPALTDPFVLPKQALFLLSALPFAAIALWQGFARLSLPALVLFLTGAFISSTNARAPESAWTEIALWVTAAAFGLACARRSLAIPLLALAALQVGIGAAEICWAPSPFRVGTFPARLKFFGTLGNPEYVALLIAMASFHLLYPERVLSRAWRSGLALLFSVGMVLARSEGPVLALLVTVGILEARRGRRWAWGLVVLATSLAAALAPISHTIRGRYLIARVAWQAAVEAHGLGVGSANLMHHFLPQQAKYFAEHANLVANAGYTRHAHNEFLDFLAEGGIALLLVLLWVFLTAGRKILREKKPSADAAIVLYTALASLGTFPLHVLPTLMIFSHATARIVSRGEPQRRQPWAIAVLLVLLGWQGPRQIDLMQAAYFGRQAELAHDAGEMKRAETSSQRAIWHDPENLRYRLTLARVLHEQGRSPESLATLQTLEKIGTTVDTLKLRGLLHFEAGRYELARQAYLELQSAIPWQITSHYYLGEIDFRRGAWSSAEREFREVLARKAVNTKALRDQMLARRRLTELTERSRLPELPAP